jgi:hypothetical protein
MHKPFKLAELSRTAAGLIAGSKQTPKSNVVPLRDGRSRVALRPQEK